MKYLLLLITLALALGLTSTGQSTESPSETKLKAAYLYNFAKFIHWPEDTFANAQAPLVIGVLGKNPFTVELTPLTTRKVRNRAITIQHFKTIKDIQHCHILYITPSISKNLQTILKDLRFRPIVTVSDNRNFANQGGVIQFVTRRERLRFVINLDIAKANNIKIDSQLLSLAVEILEAGK